MTDNVPIASYTELLKRRLSAVQNLVRSLRASEDALLLRDTEKSGQFIEEQTELCNEIEYLDRDLRSADEILEWAKALKPNTKEIRELRAQTTAAEHELGRNALVHGSLVRRAKRSLTIMMNLPAMSVYDSPASYEALQRVEEA